MKTTSITQDINELGAMLAAFEGGIPTPVKSQQQSVFEAQVIDRLMHRKFVPFKVAKSMIEEFAGTVKWAHLFNNSPEMCAGQIWQRVQNGIEDIDI